MLQAFSDRIKNSRWLGYLIVAFISVPFALWGIQAYFTGGGPDEVAEVNGVAIPTHVLDREAGERRQQIREERGGSLPDDFDDTELRQRVLDELINDELLAQAASGMGMSTNDEQVARMIRDQEFFQRNGSFDVDLYRQVLARSGMQPADYEARMRRADRIRQLERGLVDSSFVLPSEARHIATLERQQREVSLLRIPADAAEDIVRIDDEEVRRFYDEHADRFMTPRQLRIEYLSLDMDQLAETIDVNEEEIRAEFERRVQQAEGDAEREAEHIMIELGRDATDDEEQEARDLLERLRNETLEQDADFAELAREYSDDIGSAEQGGDLGPISRGDMDEDFERALFELDEVGALSEPVRTRFGLHLIRLAGMDDVDGPSLDDLRDEIRADLQRRQAEEFFFDRVDALVNAAYENPGSLEPAAEATGIEIEESDWFSRSDGAGIGDHEAIRAAAFDDDVRIEGRNSDLIEIDDRHVAVLRLVQEREPESIPFADVEAEVRDELRQTRIAEMREGWLRDLRADLDEGTNIEALAERETPPITLDGPATVRFDTREGPFPRDVNELAFDLPVPEREGVPSVEQIELDDGEQALLLVHSVTYPEPESDQVAQFEFLLQRLSANAEIQAWIETLRSKADIEINERRVRRGADDSRR